MLFCRNNQKRKLSLLVQVHFQGVISNQPRVVNITHTTDRGTLHSSGVLWAKVESKFISVTDIESRRSATGRLHSFIAPGVTKVTRIRGTDKKIKSQRVVPLNAGEVAAAEDLANVFGFEPSQK